MGNIFKCTDSVCEDGYQYFPCLNIEPFVDLFIKRSIIRKALLNVSL